jgi:DNA-binding CsgD family transcriptional regulator
MKVNGISLLTRKTLVTRRFGSEAWHGLFRDVALRHPCFRRPITAGGTIPLPEFLDFHDELVRRFFPDGKSALLELGADAARWVHTEGPLKRFVQETDIDSLVGAMPKLWQRYFTETDSYSEARLCDSGVEFKVHDLPAWHPYFEHFVTGYMKEMLELYCANPVWTRRLTGGRGRTYAYLLATDPVAESPSTESPSGDFAASQSTAASSRLLHRPRTITARELEVLRLVGTGKTNREIAFLLGISEKTVQHHVANAYDKLGLYSRAGAATWLAEHGLAR